MTNLYMRQKVFSWKDRFTIWGEDHEDRYYVEGEFFSLGKKLHIYDAQGRELGLVAQKPWSFKPRFFVYVQGIQVAEVVKEITFFKPKYTINGLNWEVAGDVFGHNYEIRSQGRSVVRVHKQWLTWGDSYEIDILDNRDEINALAVVLAIDAVLAMQEAAAAASSSTN